MSVPHRPKPLRVLTLQPAAPANGRLVVMSHGLWDDPESFEGWGEVLAAHGYTVLLPDHPGSDFNQQKAMLAGDAPPPGPEQLRLRPWMSPLCWMPSVRGVFCLGLVSTPMPLRWWVPLGELPPRFSWTVVFLLIKDFKPVATTSRIRSETSVGCSSAVGFRG